MANADLHIAGLLEVENEFPERTGNRHGGLAMWTYNIFPVADGWLAILCLLPKLWIGLYGLMGRPGLAGDPVLGYTGWSGC